MMPDKQVGVTDQDVFMTRAFNAPRELVWRFWTEAALLWTWFGPDGISVPPDSVRIDLVQGGRWELSMRKDETGQAHPIRGTIASFRSPEHLEIHMDADSSLGTLQEIVLRVEFHDHGSRTRVTLHQGPFSSELRDITADGWSVSFDHLDLQLNGPLL
jgi:uncharacterized protein YndB with AHSA1/START domain